MDKPQVMVLAEVVGTKMTNLENMFIPVTINHCPFQIRNDAM